MSALQKLHDVNDDDATDILLPCYVCFCFFFCCCCCFVSYVFMRISHITINLLMVLFFSAAPAPCSELYRNKNSKWIDRMTTFVVFHVLFASIRCHSIHLHAYQLPALRAHTHMYANAFSPSRLPDPALQEANVFITHFHRAKRQRQQQLFRRHKMTMATSMDRHAAGERWRASELGRGKITKINLRRSNIRGILNQ